MSKWLFRADEYNGRRPFVYNHAGFERSRHYFKSSLIIFKSIFKGNAPAVAAASMLHISFDI